MKKFEIGAEYWDTSAVDHNDVMIIKVTRRTEKNVWFVRMRGGKPDGEPSRTKIFTNNSYEYIMPYRYSMAPVWGADHKVEDAAETTAPETDAATPDEPEPRAGMKFGELPEHIQDKVKERLCAYDRCDVIYENGAYHVSLGAFLKANYAPDFKVCGRYNADDIFTPEERVLNYANSFYEFPIEYHGKRDYRMMKAAQERGARLEYDAAGNICIATPDEPEAETPDAPQEAAHDENENGVTFKRVYAFGVDCKADDTDYICGYKASDGTYIEKKFADGLNVYCWKVGESYYDTLNAAKAAVIRRSEQTAPETDAATPDEPEAETPVSETETPANDAPETAEDNKAAAMTAQEAAARKMIAEQTTEYLLTQWESTTTNNDPFIPTVRGWLMDELQARYPEAYDKWLDSEVCEDAALREYINAAIQAEQDAAKAPQEAGEVTDAQTPDADDVRERKPEADAPAEAVSAEGQPAPAQSLNDLISAAMYGWCDTLNAYCVAAGYYEDAQGETAYKEAQSAFAELRRMGYTDAQISALYIMRPRRAEAEAGRPAPQGDASAETARVGCVKNPVAPYDMLQYHADSGTFIFENEGEAALIDALHFHADSENALRVVNALYEITHDGGGWFNPRNHPVMLDALNDYISFLTDEIEIYDNFTNEIEKEIAVGKRAEAIAIRNAFAIAATAAERTA